MKEKFALQSFRESFCLSCHTDKNLKKPQNIKLTEATGVNRISLPKIIRTLSNLDYL